MKNNPLRILFGLFFSGLFVWLAYRQIPWQDLFVVLDRVEWCYLAPYVAILLCQHALRVARWGVLLLPLGTVSKWSVAAAGSIGVTAVFLFPFRLGELVRPLLLAGKNRLPVAGVMGTVVVERVIDGLFLTAMFFLSLLVTSRHISISASLWTTGLFSFAIFGTAFFACLAGIRWREQSIRFWNNLLNRIHPKLAHRLTKLLENFLDGMLALPDARKALWVVLLTLGYWTVLSLGFSLLFKAFGLELPISAGFVLHSIYVVAIMLPAGPGFVGTFHGGVIVALSIYDVSLTEAGAFALVMHAVHGLFRCAVGLPFLFSSQVSWQAWRNFRDNKTCQT